MKISSDDVKTVGYAIAITAGIYFAYRAYNKVQNTGGDIRAAFDAISRDVSANVDTAKEYINKKYTLVADTVKETLGIQRPKVSSDNPEFVAPKYVIELPFSQWDASTKQFIIDVLKAQGKYQPSMLGGFDYSGWRVYSDGTIISPQGDYLTMDYSNIAMDTPNGYAANLVWWPNNDTFIKQTFGG